MTVVKTNLQVEMRLCHIGSVCQSLAIGVFGFGLTVFPSQNGGQVAISCQKLNKRTNEYCFSFLSEKQVHK